MFVPLVRGEASPCPVLSLLLAGGLCSLLPLSAHAEAATPLPAVPVESAAQEFTASGSNATMLGAAVLAPAKTLGASDTAALLTTIPGVQLSSGGGLASLPILHGMADDRNSIVIDGMGITSSCPNHMNPALSYSVPGNTDRITVVTGVTPVSLGGDSIGGSIIVDPAAPRYAEAGEKIAVHGSVGTSYRSINNQFMTDGDVTVATKQVSVGYNGGWVKAADAYDGNGDRILASAYQQQNHNAALALRNDRNEIILRAGYQYTPYAGFPNQFMDMTANASTYANVGYSGQTRWGQIDAKLYWKNVLHSMDFFGDRNAMMPMPMNTDGTDAGYKLEATLPLSKSDTLKLGNAFHLYRLNDWWPAVPGAYPFMGDDTFESISNGTRNVFSSYAELDKRWSPVWSGQLGFRNDIVWMDTGDVHGYSNCNSGGMMGGCSAMPGDLNYALDSEAFNARDRARVDVNFDVTAKLRYEPSAINAEEIGYARKTRSPNLYERYAWSTGAMAASMINWFGNGAAYVGNLSLQPETANTVSVSSEWHDAAQQDWSAKVTFYYSYIEDYIGVNNLGPSGMTPGVYLLQFANHDAHMLGFDIAAQKALMRDKRYGDLDIAATLGLAKGWQVNNGDALYRMQPFSFTGSLNHRLGGWSNMLELRAVTSKTDVAPYQNEQQTPSYAILNWRTTYQWGDFTIAAGIDNILNQQYYDPNGGAYVSDFSARDMAYTSSHTIGALPAYGRSLNVGVSYKF